MRLALRPLLALLLFVPSIAAAQGAPEITLAEAVRLALAESPDVRTTEAGDRGRSAAVRAARAARLPSLSLSATPSQRYGLGFDQTTGNVVSQTVESFNVGLQGSVPLYDGGRTSALVREARLRVEAAEAGLGRTRQQVALAVAQRFLTLLLDRELLAIERGALEAALAQRDRVAELVEAGARPRGDLLAQEAVVAERRTALVVAEGAVAADRVGLVQLLGLDPLAAVTFVGPDLDVLEASGVLDVPSAPLADLLEAARAARSDRRAQELAIAAAEAGVASARSQGRPSLSLQASAGTGYSSLQQQVVGAAPALPVTLPDGTPILVGDAPLTVPGDPTLATTPFFTQAADNRSGAIALSLTVPIFDRYQTRRDVVQAEIRAEEARIQLDALDRQVAADVQSAFVEATTARARLAAAEAQVAAATDALRVARDAYRLGAGTLYEVTEAEATLARAQSVRAQAAYGLVFRRALVRLAVGDVDPEALAGMLE